MHQHEHGAVAVGIVSIELGYCSVPCVKYTTVLPVVIASCFPQSALGFVMRVVLCLLFVHNNMWHCIMKVAAEWYSGFAGMNTT